MKDIKLKSQSQIKRVLILGVLFGIAYIAVLGNFSKIRLPGRGLIIAMYLLLALHYFFYGIAATSMTQSKKRSLLGWGLTLIHLCIYVYVNYLYNQPQVAGVLVDETWLRHLKIISNLEIGLMWAAILLMTSLGDRLRAKFKK